MEANVDLSLLLLFMRKTTVQYAERLQSKIMLRRNHHKCTQHFWIHRLKFMRYILKRIPCLIFCVMIIQIYIYLNLLPLTFGNVSPPKPNRTLVVVMGNLRGGEYAWRSLQTNLLDPSSADLALIIGEFHNDTSIHASKSSLIPRAKFIWFFQEYKDWGNAVDLINGTEWRTKILPTNLFKTGLFGGVGRRQGSGAIIMMIRWFLVQHIQDLKLIEKYDTFVITRSDHYYQCMHNVSEFDVRDNTVWIPPGSDFLGRTDRHLIVSSENVLDALDIYPPLVRSELNATLIRELNPERLIKEVWDRKGLEVKYFPRTMFTCAIKSDTTRWKRAEKPVPGIPCLFQKYEEEYILVQENCPPYEPPQRCNELYRSNYFRKRCYQSRKREATQRNQEGFC